MHITNGLNNCPDDDAMEKAVVDKKVENLLNVLKWDLVQQIQLIHSLVYLNLMINNFKRYP